MPFGTKIVAGSFHATATSTNNQTNKVEHKIENRGHLPSVSFDRPHRTVGIEIGATMSINYQTVSTKVFVNVPCEDTDEAEEAARRHCEEFSSRVLAEKTAEMTEIWAALDDVRRSKGG